MARAVYEIGVPKARYVDGFAEVVEFEKLALHLPACLVDSVKRVVVVGGKQVPIMCKIAASQPSTVVENVSALFGPINWPT